MRFMGKKTKLLDFIHSNTPVVNLSAEKTFFDFFSGTATVGRSFKEEGFQVSSSDILYFSYVLQKAYIENTGVPLFAHFMTKTDDGYKEAVKYLNSLPEVEGYVYNNFTTGGTQNLQKPRMFFTPNNGKKIDAIRTEIETLFTAKKISENEYFILLATLIESVSLFANVSGVYAAFLKTYDPRSVKTFFVKELDLSVVGPEGKAYNEDSSTLLSQIDTDILYLDPPYNARQYAPNYHVLETISRYDNPVANGVAGIRDYGDLKSDFCNKVKALLLLEKIATEATYKHLLLSYNSEGLMQQEEILDVLSKFGKVSLKEKDYRRFRSNNNGSSATKPQIVEHLYVLSR